MVNVSTVGFYDDDDGGGGSVSSTDEELNRVWDKLQANAAVESQRRQNDHHAGGTDTSIMHDLLEDDSVDGINHERDEANRNTSSTDTEKCPPATETPSSPPACRDPYPSSYPSDAQQDEMGSTTRAMMDQTNNFHDEIVPKRSTSTTQSTPTERQRNHRGSQQDRQRIPTLTSELTSSNRNKSDSKNQGPVQLLKNPYLSSSTNSSSVPSLPTKTHKSAQLVQPKGRKVQNQNQHPTVKASNHFRNHPTSPLVPVTSKKTFTWEQESDEKNKKYQHQTTVAAAADDDDDDAADSEDRSTSRSDSDSLSSNDSSSSEDDTSTSSSSSSSRSDTDMVLSKKKKSVVTTRPPETVDLTTADSGRGTVTTNEKKGRRAETSSSSNHQVLYRTRPSEGPANDVSQTTRRPIITAPLQVVKTVHTSTRAATTKSTNAAKAGTTTNMTSGKKTHNENNSSNNKTTKTYMKDAEPAAASFNSKLNTTRTKEGVKKRETSKNRTDPADSSHPGPSHARKDSGNQPRVWDGHLDMENINKSPSPPVYEYQNPSEMIGSIQEAEIDTALSEPPSYRERPMPVLRRFNSQQHPSEYRETVAVSDLFPEPMSLLWKSKYDRFNPCQTVVSDVLSATDDNVLISAPTGAGKTALFEMAMCRFIGVDLYAQCNKMHDLVGTAVTNLETLSKARKIVYVAPSKALCEERYNDWSRRFSALNLGVQVVMITGDGELGSSFPDLQNAHLVLTTPEKWDAMTRRWNENFYIFASCKLFLVDEVHIIGDESRGWCLESIITRMKSIHRAAAKLSCSSDEIAKSSYPDTNQDALQSAFRIVAVSATLPNILEVADALDAPEAFSFDDSYRPVPLRKIVQGMGKVYKNEWKFYNSLCQHVPEIIQRFSHGKQSLIFCHSKKETERVADLLVEKLAPNKGKRGHSSAPRGSIQYYIDNAVGFHHAGLDKENRKVVEQAFAAGRIRCLAATSTLAVGVNLPAHLVIIVGSKAYRGGNGYTAIDTSSILQMVGRAGRPGLDSSGIAVILTDNDSKQSVEHILQHGLQRAQSMLPNHLAESLNSEVSQGVIQSIDMATRWMQTTFYFSCKKKEQDGIAITQQICDKGLRTLEHLGLIQICENRTITSRPGCHVMNQHSVSHQEMASIVSWSGDNDTRQILLSLSNLIDMPVRRNEKVELKEVHKTDVVKFKLPGQLSKFTVKTSAQKAFILLQCIIGKHEFDNATLRQEMASISNSALKILRAAEDYCIQHSRNGKLGLECFRLSRSIALCMWGVDSGILNAIPGVGSYATGRLRLSGISSFEDVLKSSDKVIEASAGRSAPFGKDLKEMVAELCRDRLKLSAELECTRNSNTPSSLICRVSYEEPNRVVKANSIPTVTFSLLAYNDNHSDGSLLLWKDRVDGAGIHRMVLPPSTRFNQISVHLLGSSIGFDACATLKVGKDGESRPGQDIAVQSNQSEKVAHAPNGRKRIRQAGKNTAKKRLTKDERQPATRKGIGNDNIPLTSTRNSNIDNEPNQSSLRDHFPPRSTQVSPFVQSARTSHRMMDSTQKTAARTQPGNNNKTGQNNIPQSRSFPSSSHGQGNGTLPRGRAQTREQQSRWNKTRTQQGQSQQRAFASRRDNPFSFFSHDPNGLESHLEHLSQSQKSKQSPRRTFQTKERPYDHNNLGKSEPDRRQQFSTARSNLNVHGNSSVPRASQGWNTGVKSTRNTRHSSGGNNFASRQRQATGFKLLQEKFGEYLHTSTTQRTGFTGGAALQRLHQQDYQQPQRFQQEYRHYQPSQYQAFSNHSMSRSPEPSHYQDYSNHFTMDSQVPLEIYAESSHLNEGLSQDYYTHEGQGAYDSYPFDGATWDYPDVPMGENMDLEQDPSLLRDPMIQDDTHGTTGSSAVISPFPPVGDTMTNKETTEQEDNNPVANFADIF